MSYNNINPLDSLKYWCQKTLPSVYDDSLSYYELLSKIVDYYNTLNGSFSTLLANVADINSREISDSSNISTLFTDILEIATKRKLSENGDFTGTLNGMPIVNSDVGLASEITASRGAFINLPSRMDYITNYIKDLMINVKSFGAVGDGVNDDSIPIRSAIDYATTLGGGLVFIPEGTYLLKSYQQTLETTAGIYGYWVFKLTDNVTVMGLGDNSVLKVDTNLTPIDSDTNTNIFLSNNRNNVHVKNIKLDCNGTNNLVPTGKIRTFFALMFYLGTNCSVENCTIENNPGRNSIVFRGFTKQNGIRKNARIINNTLHNGGTAVSGNVNQTDYSAIYCDWDNSFISGNHIYNDTEAVTGEGGIELHGNNQTAIDNYLSKCYPGMYIASDFTTWAPNTAYNVGDIIIPTRANFFGKQYKCVIAGTSGADEPTWGQSTNDNTISWVDNGKAVMYNRIIERNNFEKCHTGIMIWTGCGDFDGIKIINNKLGIKQSQFRTNESIAAINQVSISSVPISLMKNVTIEDNEIFEDDTVTTTNGQYVGGIGLNTFDNVQIRKNNIHDIDWYGIYISGSARSGTNLTIQDNIISNFQINNKITNKQAIILNLTGTSTSPAKTAFDISNVKIYNNTIRNDVYNLYSYGILFDWNDTSAISGISVDNNSFINLGGIKTGNRNALVTVSPFDFFSQETGYYQNKDGLLIQWTRVTYTATAGEDQTFNFTVPFTSWSHVQATISSPADSYVSVSSHTSTGVTLKCSSTGRNIYILAIGQ